jgi:AraC family transcriptional regulator
MRRLSHIQKKQGLILSDRASGLLLALLLEELCKTDLTGRKEFCGTERVIPLVIDWIEHHTLPLPPLKEIAAFAGWSVNYFRGQFRAASGQTVGEFLKRRRMSEAARLLAETRRPIKEIAMQAGYAEVTAFHRAFSLRYKVTPRQFRYQRAPTI